MEPKPITRNLFQVFVASFAAWVGSMLAFIAARSSGAGHTDFAPVEKLLFALWIVSGSAWYISLGVAASRLGRSWLAWVALSSITAPLGSLAAFLMMLGHMKAALTITVLRSSQDHPSIDETPGRRPE